MRTAELMQNTRATYRQIDYWTRIGLIQPAVDACGSGSRRTWDPKTIPIMDLLHDLQAGLGSKTGMSGDVMRSIVENFDRGYINITPTVRLCWTNQGES